MSQVNSQTSYFDAQDRVHYYVKRQYTVKASPPLDFGNNENIRLLKSRQRCLSQSSPVMASGAPHEMTKNIQNGYQYTPPPTPQKLVNERLSKCQSRPCQPVVGVNVANARDDLLFHRAVSQSDGNGDERRLVNFGDSQQQSRNQHGEQQSFGNSLEALSLAAEYMSQNCAPLSSTDSN
ncbi:hypothetical protein MIR68_000911 [Amoeboaphelidium protococcarum]|nr:hypothetical protein MIR68_000911 [Amoeboaphelidium protococcarum]